MNFVVCLGGLSSTAAGDGKKPIKIYWQFKLGPRIARGRRHSPLNCPPYSAVGWSEEVNFLLKNEIYFNLNGQVASSKMVLLQRKPKLFFVVCHVFEVFLQSLLPEALAHLFSHRPNVQPICGSVNGCIVQAFGEICGP